MVPRPFPSSVRGTFWQRAVGAVLSTTVTTAVQVALLVEASATVRVTLLVPTLAQVKAVWLRVVLATPQLSVEPLLTAAALVLAVPAASRVSVTG